MRKNHKNRVDEAKLVGFARSYLAESFPNPDRIGCPPMDMLRRLAEQPTSADLSVTEHLGSCSPCFQQYQEVLAHTRAEANTDIGRTRTMRMVYVALASAALVVFLLIWFIQHVSGPKSPQEAVLDLRNTSANRGSDATGSDEPPKLLRMRERVLIYLPVGVEGSFRLDIFDEADRLVATTSGDAKIEDSLSVLLMPLDLSHQSPGIYSFRLRRNTGFVRIYKVRLE
jgi:hypothetical protein